METMLLWKGEVLYSHSFPLKSKDETAFHVSMDETLLWHKRYGHSNLETPKLMADIKMVTNMPIMNTRRSLCSVCEEGKSHRLPFPTQQIRRATKKLELVHTEICGPMHTDLMNGSKYFILFIDDFSRYTWIHFMKMKSEAFQMFIKFKALAKKETNLKIKTLRSDNGAEFLSNQFQEFLQQNGIIHQLSAPYSPQQNGVYERKNR